MLICHCAVINDRRIRAEIDGGAADLLDIASACGAGSFCGGCVPAIASLLSEKTGTSASAFLDHAPTTVEETQPLKKQVQQVARAIEEDIAAKGWPVGQSLGALEELADRYGANRTQIRQALDVLKNHGMVDADPLLGVVVGAPDAERVLTASVLQLQAAGVTPSELIEARQVLEGLAVQQVSEQADEQITARLRAAAGDTPGAAARGSGFHDLIAASTGNPMLLQFIRILGMLTQDRWQDVDPSANRTSSSYSTAAHLAIADAISAGNSGRARDLLLAHLDAVYLQIRSGPAAPEPERLVGRGRVAHEQPSKTDVVRAVVGLAAARGLRPGQVIGSPEDLASALALEQRTVRDVIPLLEYYGVATQQPGPKATISVAVHDPWPAAQLLALYLDFTDVTPTQLLDVLEALELRAVELASQRITPEEAERLRNRLREETAVRRRHPLEYRAFHNIHPMIARLSGNRVIALFGIVTILSLRRVSRDATAERPLSNEPQDIEQAHADIVEAICAHDVPLSRHVMRSHLAAHLLPMKGVDPA